MICCKDFPPYTVDQQTLSWGQFFFLRSTSMSHFSSILSMGNHQVFFIFLKIQSRTLASDEIQDSHSLNPFSHPYEPSSYHNPIQRWVEQACGDTSQPNFSLLPTFMSLILYLVML